MTSPLETTGLGKRYGRSWALRDCTVAIPEGSITALIGPNGAGKTTFLQIAIGLAAPTDGTVAVFGRDPKRDAAAVLPRLGFVAQDHPLYSRLSVAEMCEVGARLNDGWDRSFAEARLRSLGLDPKQRVGKLSGGQQAQLALVLALAKHPKLLLLDEPTASLDPHARREFMQVLMDTVVGDGATVVLSSHNVADLERVCDHLVILGNGRVVAAADLDAFRTEHRLLVGPRASDAELAGIGEIVTVSHTGRQTTAVVRGSLRSFPDRWVVSDLSFEDLVIEYLARSTHDRIAASNAPVDERKVAS